MLQARAMAGLTRQFLRGISRVIEKQPAHLRLSQVLKDLLMTPYALFSSCKTWFWLGKHREQ